MEIVERFKGCLIGCACGDYLGMPVETFTPEEVLKSFGEKGVRPIEVFDGRPRGLGYYTDDTSMTLCLAESLLTGFDTIDQLRRYQKWLTEGYLTPDGGGAFGVGQTTFKSLTTQKTKDIPRILNNNDRTHLGNGALMRCSPVGLVYFQKSGKVIKYSIESAIVTHNNPIAAWSCVVLNLLIAYCLRGLEKSLMLGKVADEIRQQAPAEILELLDGLTNEKDLPNSGKAINTLRITLTAFTATANFRDAVSQAIMYGGDTDTQGAVTGALAGAFYGVDGIPTVWRRTLMNRGYIEKLAEKLFEKAG